MKFELALRSMVLSLLILSCATKDNNSVVEATDNDEWPEMEAFHMTMAEAFHPLKDSGNVGPAMHLMGQLAEESEKWAAAPLPEKVNNDEIKAKIEKLKNDIRDLSDEVNDDAPEDQVGTALFTIHDQFHEIMEAWQAGVEKNEHEEKH